MKVFFLPGAYDGCYYYRCYMPGIHGDMSVVLDFARKDYKPEQLIQQAMEADIIVIQRPNEPVRYEIAKALKARGKKIVFENDDTYLPDKGIPLSMLSSDKQRDIAKKMNYFLYETLKISDMAIASTPLLGEEFKAINENVVVIPNFIDPLDEQDKRENDTGRPRVGFIGSVTSNNDYSHVKDEIRKVAEYATIVVFGIKHQSGTINGAYKDDYEFWNSLPNVDWQPFVNMNSYYHTLSKLKLDLVIIPRNDSYFNKCKSNLKFLEASLLKIPVIAQGFETNDSPYQQNPEDSKHMVVITDNTKWNEEIQRLLNDKELREAMAQKAYEYVIKNYNIKDNVHRWIDAFKTIYAN
jgi:glycosyltransferase involved in cell wall biosynthesis